MSEEKKEPNNYFIVVYWDPNIVSKIVSAFRDSGWSMHGELQIFTGIADDGNHRIHYVQVVVK